MPLPETLVVPEATPLTVALDPVQNAFHSLLLLIKGEYVSGLGDWVSRTLGSLTPAERETHRLVFVGFYYAILPEQRWPDFTAYLGYLETVPPHALCEKMLSMYARFLPLSEGDGERYAEKPAPVDWDEVLQSVDRYLDFLRVRFAPEHMDEALEAQAYHYVVDPPKMQRLIVSHLQAMWDKYLAPEWRAVETMLQDAVSAFRQVDVRSMGRLEAARVITGQDLPEEYWEELLERAEQIVFVPSAHVGPYVGWLAVGKTLWVLFGARLPEGSTFLAPDLSRAEIVVRLGALADDRNLRILRLISERGEMSSQEVMESLDLSQSTASRHLKQLSATGYLSERRCNGAKCYQLCAERVESTLQAVADFLLGR